MLEMTFDLLPIFGSVLSILAFIVPKFNTWYAALEAYAKQLFMVGVLAVIGAAVGLLSAFGLLDVYTVCAGDWACYVWKVLVDIGFAVIANAGTYKATNYIGDKAVTVIAAKFKK